MKKLVRLTESDLHKIVKESVNRIINENDNSGRPTLETWGTGNTSFDKEIPQIIHFLSDLGSRLESGLIGVEGFVGGNRMDAMSNIRRCISTLKKMRGNIYLTNVHAKMPDDSSFFPPEEE